jgi:hypothetical protein
MKLIKPAIFIMILALSSYASLWYGFAKGYQYRTSQSLLDAFITASNLQELREGKTEKVISSLEMRMDTNIIEWYVSDRNFINYIIALPKPDPQTDAHFLKGIVKYKESTNTACTLPSDVCATINTALYSNQHTP